jgi:hypothetical protein
VGLAFLVQTLCGFLFLLQLNREVPATEVCSELEVRRVKMTIVRRHRIRDLDLGELLLHYLITRPPSLPVGGLLIDLG